MDSSMRTVLDVTECTHSRGGVGRWVRGLSRGLYEANPNHMSVDVSETHPGHESTVSRALLLPRPFWMNLPLIRRFLLKKGILESTRAARLEKAVGTPDIIHLSGVQPYGRGRQRVVTFFDDTPWTEPHSHNATTLFYAGRLKKLIDSGASVLAISGWAAETAQNLFGIPEEKTGNAGGAADDLFTPGEPDMEILSGMNIKKGEYFLHVGSYVPRKNIPFLVKCFEEAEKGTKKLVLAGAEAWGDEVSRNSPGVVYLKSASDTELLALYRGALALLLPSSSEGLGLPVMEAFACGTPVIASDGGALPETVGSGGLLLPVLERGAWVKSIEDASAGRTISKLRELALNAPRPTWQDAGRKAMDFYRSLQ
jgi:glycosyltransferase involved in cell wall biosynthesis